MLARSPRRNSDCARRLASTFSAPTDSTGRLLRATRGPRTDQWTYDVFGNRATTYWNTTEGGESLQGPSSCKGAANPSSY